MGQPGMAAGTLPPGAHAAHTSANVQLVRHNSGHGPLGAHATGSGPSMQHGGHTRKVNEGGHAGTGTAMTAGLTTTVADTLGWNTDAAKCAHQCSSVRFSASRLCPLSTSVCLSSFIVQDTAQQ